MAFINRLAQIFLFQLKTSQNPVTRGLVFFNRFNHLAGPIFAAHDQDIPGIEAIGPDFFQGFENNKFGQGQKADIQHQKNSHQQTADPLDTHQIHGNADKDHAHEAGFQDDNKKRPERLLAVGHIHAHPFQGNIPGNHDQKKNNVIVRISG